MRDANSSALSLLREPMAAISWLVWARTDSMNRSAIQPEPRIPHRKMGASLGGAIRDAGKDEGSDIEVQGVFVTACTLVPFESAQG
jgi:hypothetical protein